MIGSRAIWCWTLGAVLMSVPVLAGDTVLIQVETVLASDRSQEFDPRLTDMRPRLETFRYESYRLVQKELRRVRWGKQADFMLPGGRFLQVVPKSYAHERVVLQVMLMEGAAPTPLLSTQLSLRNHGELFVAGRKHQGGILIIRIGAAAEEGAPVEQGTAVLPPAE